MYKRLISYIERKQILSKHQYGFRKNRSTEHAIIELTDKISKAIDEGKFTFGIFLDLSKAFHTVNHKILFKKLEHYGIRVNCLKWFENYLYKRTQIVKIGNHRSNKRKISTGVPQGSILGPLLFLLYINDIENCSEIISFVMYADDTNAFYSDKNLKSLTNIMQEEMNKVTNWLNVNKLSINTTKTKYIIFKSSNKKCDTEINIQLNPTIMVYDKYNCLLKIYGIKIITKDIKSNDNMSLYYTCLSISTV